MPKLTNQLQGRSYFLSSSAIHLGLTTRCNLKCPFCTRTIAKKTERNIWITPYSDKNPSEPFTKDLSLAEYKKFFNNLNIKTVILCGNWGDTIYYPDLFDLLEYSFSFFSSMAPELGSSTIIT